MSDLPNWPGASVVYSRAHKINAAKCAAAYAAATTGPKHKRRKYYVPEDVENIIPHLNAGNEEALKAYVAANLSLALAESV